jgi:subtilisin-like proprotein convertase family protein
VSINNSLQVSAALPDSLRNDITLNATGGSVFLGSNVSAINRVQINQMNELALLPTPSPAPNNPGTPIRDRSTAVQTVTVSDARVFDRLTVQVNVAHTNLSQLTLTLVAPNNARVRLAENPIGFGGFVNTVFDDSASIPIASGRAPYAGSFRPQDSLSILNGISRRGVWRLEVQDSAGGFDSGTINSFQLNFFSPQAVDGSVVGYGKIFADALSVAAEGFVGNPAQSQTSIASQFFLATDVNTLNANVGRSIAINEAGSLVIPALSAGGLVTLRAGGVDRDPNTAALVGNLDSVNAIDVSAPNGSIDIRVSGGGGLLTLGNPSAIRTGGTLGMLAGGAVRIRTGGGTAVAGDGTILAYDAPLAGSGARRVRAAVQGELSGDYAAGSPSIFASTITARASGPLVTAVAGLPSDLRVGDEILVAGGAATNGVLNRSSANGIYTVTALGSPNSKWVLTRSKSADTATEFPTNSFVSVGDGDLGRAFYQLVYEGAFTQAEIAVNPVLLTTNIGSDDRNDPLVLVVQNSSGGNLSPGSLGKALLLGQTDDTTSSESNPKQVTRLGFASGVDSIFPSAELSTIFKSIDIDGGVRYQSDGSVVAAAPVSIGGSKISTTKSGLPVTNSTPISGFVFSGADASGSRLANISLSDFSRGAAVTVDSAQNVRLDNVTLGLRDGVRAPNKIGILVTGTASGTTITGSTIASSSEAGVKITSFATATTIVGTTIGMKNADNRIGVQVDSVGAATIGLEPITSRNRVQLTQSSKSFTLPIAVPVGGIHVGQTVVGGGIPLGAKITSIDAATRTITLSANPTVSGRSGVSFGAPARNRIQYNGTGVVLANGAVRMVNTDIGGNALNGIDITGGAHMIGSGSKLSSSTVAVYGNGGWGINVSAGAAASQRIVNSYLGLSSTGGIQPPYTANSQGNIVVNVAARAAAFVPSARTSIDRNGNKHRPVSGGQPSRLIFGGRPR